MGIKPSVLLTDKSLEEFFALLLDAFPEVSETDEMRKLRFIELAAEMEQFLSESSVRQQVIALCLWGIFDYSTKPCGNPAPGREICCRVTRQQNI